MSKRDKARKLRRKERRKEAHAQCRAAFAPDGSFPVPLETISRVLRRADEIEAERKLFEGRLWRELASAFCPTRESRDGDVHCIPTGPLEKTEHSESHACWCCPGLAYVDAETHAAVWVHRETQ